MVYGPAQCYTCSRVVGGAGVGAGGGGGGWGRVHVSIFSISALFFCFLLNVLFFFPQSSHLPFLLSFFFWVQGADTNDPQLA